MNSRGLIGSGIALIFLLVIILWVCLMVINKMDRIEGDIEFCKSKGYDSVREKNKIVGAEIECSNFTELEKFHNERDKEKINISAEIYKSFRSMFKKDE